MASSSKATGQHWWLGWYALAYVPDELQDDDGEKLTPAMTKLTEDGDIIYNIFQGDMNGDGYQTTKASSRFKSVNYDSNIKKNYRYVLDETGRNNLVTFVDGKHGLKGACVYKGVQVVPSRDDNEISHKNSEIPLPAPLLYTGVKAAGEGWSENGMNIFLGSGNDNIENFYPIDTVGNKVVPRVSTDFRNYEGYKSGLPKIEGGAAEDYTHVLDDTFDGVDKDGWFPSVSTYTQDDETDMDKPYNQYCRQYWKVLSISNFNKYCAPVNASGLLYDENTGCRNMAKATKYFPISDYSVTSTAKTADNEYATGIKLKVQLKLNGNAEDGSYFKDVETGSEGNVATLNPSPTEDEQALFNTQQVSFRFNRIGIYAVPMRQYGCSGDNGEMKAQFQIDTEAEPVLFAVCEWDSPVTLSDSGEGLSEFQSDIFIDLSAAVDDSSVIRESAVFYNLYEDDAIDWYKNQLVANASIAEALVNMQIEMGYLRNQKNGKQACCPKTETIQQQKSSSSGLRNLVDAKDYNSNSVRNRLGQEEGTSIGTIYSDVEPNLGAIGRPTGDGSINVLARESTDGTSTVYSAVIGARQDPRHAVDYGDAIFDDCTYMDMLVTPIVDAAKSIRIGNLWVRTSLYYELYSFGKPSTPSSENAWDYPDNADTNNYGHSKTWLTDYFGSGTLNTGLPSVLVKRTANGVTTTDVNGTISGLPTDLLSEVATSATVPALVNEINRSLENYETERDYTVYYYPSSTSRSYDGYKCRRMTHVTLPKIQLYRLDSAVLGEINSRIESTGWRIPSTEDWDSIISNTAKDTEKATAIRSASKWTATGGTGDVYPLGGFAVSRGAVQPSLYTGDAPVIYLAIADDASRVVAFDGTKFEIIGKTIPEIEAGLSHVAILCVADATVITDGIDKYKLGDDSYSLMEGSITEGNHSFNAGEKSVILASANYNSIFGGMYNKIEDSDHNAILNGYHNELLGAVFSCVFGSGNVLKTSSAVPACRMLVDGMNTIVSGGATSFIFAENSYAESLYQSSVMGDACDIRNMYCSRFIGQSTSLLNRMVYSDVIAYASHHMPYMAMSRAIVTNDHRDDLPSTLSYDSNSHLYYSDIIGYKLHFLEKKDVSDNTTIAFSHLTAGADVGIVNTMAGYSDIFAYEDASDINSWFALKTLESVTIAYSDIKLCSASITSAYIDGDVYFGQNRVNFCDISLAQSFIQLGEANANHSVNFGIMKLSYSMISKCDCSYIYETGTRHFLTSARVHYATLFGNLISLSSNYIRNTHIYGSLTLNGSLDNHIILGGLDGTSVGNFSASSYIADFGSYITQSYKNYPMIWSLGGIGLYMNKIVLGDKGVSSSKAPSVGDVLSVVGVEDNMATVAWKSVSGGGGGSSDYYPGDNIDIDTARKINVVNRKKLMIKAPLTEEKNETSLVVGIRDDAFASVDALNNETKLRVTGDNQNQQRIDQVDADLNAEIQNRIEAVSKKQDKLTFDYTPTADSTNPVTSDGIKKALDAKQDDISSIIPADASSTNQVATKAYADAIGERLEARYLGYDTAGNPFPTHAALTNATTYYYQGQAVAPDTNDITTVTADEDHLNESGVACVTRYRWNGTAWAFEYVINNTGLNEAQLLAVNSGITSTKVAKYDGYEQQITDAGNNVILTYGQTPTRTYAELVELQKKGKLWIKDEYGTGFVCFADVSKMYSILVLDASEEVRALRSDLTWVKSTISLQKSLTFDSTPTADSTNPVTSDGIKTALDQVDADLNAEIQNRIEAVSKKQDSCYFFNSSTSTVEDVQAAITDGRNICSASGSNVVTWQGCIHGGYPTLTRLEEGWQYSWNYSDGKWVQTWKTLAKADYTKIAYPSSNTTPGDVLFAMGNFKVCGYTDNGGALRICVVPSDGADHSIYANGGGYRCYAETGSNLSTTFTSSTPYMKLYLVDTGYWESAQSSFTATDWKICEAEIYAITGNNISSSSILYRVITDQTIGGTNG